MTRTYDTSIVNSREYSSAARLSIRFGSLVYTGIAAEVGISTCALWTRWLPVSKCALSNDRQHGALHEAGAGAVGCAAGPV